MNTTKNKIAPCEVLYIAENSPWGEIGHKTVAAAFRDVTPVLWSPDMPKPDLTDWHGDWIISFKSDLILPASVIERADKGAINFHPCPPKYRGLGGYWWARHNDDASFGVTCHHMNERIDHGDIIKVDNFAIWQGETEKDLKHKAALYSLNLLNGVLSDIVAEKPLEPCGTQWEPHLYTQKQLDAATAQKTTAEDILVSNPSQMVGYLAAQEAAHQKSLSSRSQKEVA